MPGTQAKYTETYAEADLCHFFPAIVRKSYMGSRVLAANILHNWLFKYKDLETNCHKIIF